jgi:hypothetical protein
VPRRALLIGTVLLGLLALLARPLIRHSKRLWRPAPAPVYDFARQAVLRAMAERPADPWPRGLGHVVLAFPGSRENEKSYLEPGGSFSPEVGSFGVSIWVVNGRGDLVATSDNLPLGAIQQHFEWAAPGIVPAIVTQNPWFQSTWTHPRAALWTLDLKGTGRSNLSLVIRSVGPAGGPITSLAWAGGELWINDRWSMRLEPAAAPVALGHEGDAGWVAHRSDATRWTGSDGWGYARFELRGAASSQLTITDHDPLPAPELSTLVVPTFPRVELPDPSFADGLHAQLAHLMMGLVGRETRPGEPLNYPVEWLRDGAYAEVALARAGQTVVARALASDFAERDFFGGFGPEADGPALSIWALEELALVLRDPGYDRAIWPHIYRKAEWILRMLSTAEPIHTVVSGPIVPAYLSAPDLSLVCDAAHDGLIMGRMDWRRPVLYVNAVNYRGLLDAADLADRVGAEREARAWRERAEALRHAWEAALPSPAFEDDRTFISGTWPSWIAAGSKTEFRAGLQARWDRMRSQDGSFRESPLWTYFEIADAHQWLYLDRPDRTWSTLRWFWTHQASPGLYTWWEGDGEENSFHQWGQVRGWVRPPYVSPHYWTAAEMLLLQLDMLAYVDRSDPRQPALIVGAGIPGDWTGQALAARGLLTALGSVDWEFRPGLMHVTVHGAPCAIRLGRAFDPHTRLQTDFVPIPPG